MLWIEKYRPRSFEEIIGQDPAVSLLSQFADEGTLPHLMLIGPHGTGKSAATECLARNLYGEYWLENTSVFNTRELFSQGKAYLRDDERFSHLFKKELSLISNFKYIVKWYASLRPLDAEFKLMVFEGATALTFEAQQALRRIMEHYSTTCRFIFCAQNQSGIIPAISSRCLPLFFSPIPGAAMASHLSSILEAEAIPPERVTHETLDLIVQASRGDLRKALVSLEIAARVDEELDLSELEQSETSAVSEALYAALARKDLRKARTLAETLMIEYGLSGRECIGELRGIIRREYNDPRAAIALADADAVLGHAGNEIIQIEALLARLIEEVFG